MGLTLLSQASLLTYWDYAFFTAVYLINRLPSASIQFQVPYTVLFKTKPDYKFLKVFGCACFPLLRPYHAHTLDFRSQECLFLGYSTSHKGYRCLSSNGRLFTSKDVLFNESRFPYQSLFSKFTPISSTSAGVSLSPLPFNNSPSLHSPTLMTAPETLPTNEFSTSLSSPTSA